MRTLDEQWIENGRMYKAVEGPKIVNGLMEGNTCHGCCHVDNWDDDCLHPSKLCPLDKGLIVKDLGPVNEDGVLAEERTGLFPVVENHFHNLWAVTIITNDFPKIIQVSCYGATKQQAIDAWNWMV